MLREDGKHKIVMNEEGLTCLEAAFARTLIIMMQHKIYVCTLTASINVRFICVTMETMMARSVFLNMKFYFHFNLMIKLIYLLFSVMI